MRLARLLDDCCPSRIQCHQLQATGGVVEFSVIMQQISIEVIIKVYLPFGIILQCMVHMTLTFVNGYPNNLYPIKNNKAIEQSFEIKSEQERPVGTRLSLEYSF